MNHQGKQTATALWIAAAVCVLSIAISIPVYAQLSGATLSGIVKDESGGSVAGASVSIKNVATGSVREVTTNSDGLYSAPNLPPGEYETKVSAKGFSTLVQKGVTLTVGAQQALNLTLKVGQITQTVEVTAAPPAVELTTSTISATVEQKTVVELPLNGRDWTQLATLQPGVISIRAQASTSSTANRGNRGFGDQLADSGHRPNENTYRVDGISVNDYSNGAPGSVLGAALGVDAIQEFSVVTTNYTAEYGRTSGAVINAITKSGTNQFHGSAYGFDRDKIFDARDFFTSGPLGPFHRAQFGASAGGPIIKDKTFIFGDYEGIRQAQFLALGTQKVPSAAARGGMICSVPNTPTSCTPHTITIDPAVAPFLALWPTSTNLSPTGNGDIALINTSGQKVVNENYVTVKADHKISDKDSLSGSYFFDNAPQTQPDNLNNVIHEIFTRRQMVSLTESHIFSPRLANIFRFGFNRVVGLVNQPVSAINKAAADTTLGTVPGFPAALLHVSGLTNAGGLGFPSFFGHHWNSFQAYDDLFFTHGKHSLKFGFAFERMQYNDLAKVRGNGDFTFSSLGAFPGVSGLENFLLNRPNRVLLLDPTVRNEVGSRDSLFAGYAQDDWRVLSNLTINLGLRYEFLTNPTEAHDGFGLVKDFFNNTVLGFNPTINVKNQFESNPTARNFDPRVGFSWDPFNSGRTAIRGGFGIFSVLPLPYIYTIGNSLTLPFSRQTKTTNLPAGSFPKLTGVVLGNNAGTRFVEQNPHRSYAMNWNLNVQRSITKDLTAMVGYVGSHVLHEAFTTDDSNMVVPTLVNGRLFWPTPIGSGSVANVNVGFIRPIFFDGASKYNGLQSQLQLRATHGLQAQASYTYGRCFSDGDGAQLGDPYLTSVPSLMFFSKKQSRHGPCDFDIRQNLVVNFLYNIPGVKPDSGLRWILNGWQVGGIVGASTGVPFTMSTEGSDPLGQNSTDPWDYPDRVTGCNPVNSNYKSNGLQYVNLNCFTVPVAPAGNTFPCQAFTSTSTPNSCANLLGNAGRNQIYGPKLVNVDWSVVKNTAVPRISESFNVQFRAEFFNLFNHPHFQAPNFDDGNNALFDSSGAIQNGAGVLASTIEKHGRQIQFGLKIVW